MDWLGLLISVLETLGMTIISTILAYIIGIPLGVLLNVTGKNGIKKNPILNTILGLIVNLLRSIPCMLLVVLVIPMNRAIVGGAFNHWYSMIIPLFFASFAYVARIVEQSLNEVSHDEIEGIRSLGASDLQITLKVLIPESKSSLITGISVTAVNIIGYTAFAYDFGNGGIISFIYSTAKASQWTNIYTWEIWVAILLVVLLVQAIQEIGLTIAKSVDKRRKTK